MHTFAHNNRHRYAKKQQIDPRAYTHLYTQIPANATIVTRHMLPTTIHEVHLEVVSLKETSRRPKICVKNKDPSILGKGGNHTGIS